MKLIWSAEYIYYSNYIFTESMAIILKNKNVYSNVQSFNT